jgi:hypothetical protein
VSSENATWPELALFSSTADAPKFRLVGYTEGRAILRAGSAAVVEAYGGHVGMTEPLLHFAQAGAAIRRVGSGGGAQGVRAEAPQINAGGQRVFPQHAVVNRAIGERPVNVPLPCRVFERPESGRSVSPEWPAA